MSTYVLMKILESAPHRYDLGIRLLTLGGLERVYDHLVERIRAGHHVLDIGCGTGALTERAAKKGATVKGIDINAAMLEIAEQRIRQAGLAEHVVFCETGVSGLDHEESARYDAVMSGLCFSELSDDEIAYALDQIRRILKPDGLLLFADEIRPSTFAGRLAYFLVRVPLAALTYVVTQQTTRPVENIPGRVANAGLSVESQRTTALGSLLELVARKPAEVA